MKKIRDPKALARDITNTLISEIAPQSGSALLHDVVHSALLKLNAHMDSSEAHEVAEDILEFVRGFIRDHQVHAEAEGRVWTLELIGSEGEWIRGAASPDPSLNEAIRDARLRRGYVGGVLRELISLSPTQFETACTKILDLLGCKNTHTSPVRDDGGIDFYGQLSLRGRLDSPHPLGGIDARTNVWLIGQAKHYPINPIRPSVIRELIGSVELARTKGAIHVWEGLHLAPFEPTVMLVFTTGHFSRGSKALLANSGVLSMDGPQLAAFLCDVGLGFSSDQQFTADQFRGDLLRMP